MICQQGVCELEHCYIGQSKAHYGNNDALSTITCLASTVHFVCRQIKPTSNDAAMRMIAIHTDAAARGRVTMAQV